VYNKENKCCLVGCEKDAIWDIRDLDNENPYENDTYSCAEHLGSLLNLYNNVFYIGPTIE
jgi:hypothetical protein